MDRLPVYIAISIYYAILQLFIIYIQEQRVLVLARLEGYLKSLYLFNFICPPFNFILISALIKREKSGRFFLLERLKKVNAVTICIAIYPIISYHYFITPILSYYITIHYMNKRQIILVGLVRFKGCMKSLNTLSFYIAIHFIIY